MNRIGRRHFLGFAGGVLLLAACGREAEPEAQTSGESGGRLRLGYFPNITHAQPNVGLELGIFQKELGDAVSLETKTFNAGPSVIEAMFAGALDASYIGPNPAINGYVQSGGRDIRIIAGATSGGALFVIRPDRGIQRPADFAGKRLATPQLGNTQDVALRAWLKQNGLATREQGGNVIVLPTANADTLTLFQKGDIDGAWVPEPWGTRLVQEAGGKVYLDERSLWPNGDFVTTHLIVRAGYLAQHQEIVRKLLRAHVEITDYIVKNPAEAKQALNRAIEKATSAALPTRVIDGAWENQRITYDPIAASLKKSADDAYALGFLERKPDLSHIYELGLLNDVLREKQLPPVEGLL